MTEKDAGMTEKDAGTTHEGWERHMRGGNDIRGGGNDIRGGGNDNPFSFLSFLSPLCHSCESRNPSPFLLEKRKGEQKKTGERLRRSELLSMFGECAHSPMLEKFLSGGLGENFFQKVSPPTKEPERLFLKLFFCKKKRRTKENR